MLDLKSPSRWQGPDGVPEGLGPAYDVAPERKRPSGLCDLPRVLGPLIHAFARKQTLLVEYIQQDEGWHDQERGESGRDEHRRDRSGRRCRL